MAILDKHAILEKSPTLLLTFSLLVVTIGGIVEIAPLFWLENTIEEVEGVRPYSPARTDRSRHLYARRLLCLPQPDDPPDARRGRALWPLFTGGGIACTTTRSSGDQSGRGLIWRGSAGGIRMPGTWIICATRNRSCRKASCRNTLFWLMPGLTANTSTDLLETHRFVGVPYTDEQIEAASADFHAQADPDADWDGCR